MTIYESAINTFGEKCQIDKAIEELIELTHVLIKYKKLENSLDLDNFINIIAAVIDEIADVSIILPQLELLFDKGLINNRKEFKLNRLQTIIDEVENEKQN
jgi:phosphosulfolactate synthase (CoM biosynthesis protein A)